MTEKPGAERNEAERAGGGEPVSGSRKMTPRFYLLAAAVAVGAAVPLHHGLLSAGLIRAMGAERPGTGGSALLPVRPGGEGPAPPPAQAPSRGSGSGGAAVPTATSTPAPDPRIVRALHTPVHVLAGAGSLWTTLGSLGARLTWPESGEPQWKVEGKGFNHGLRRLARRVEQLPRNARLVHSENGFHALSPRAGRMMDRAAAQRQLLALLAQPSFRASLDALPDQKPAALVLSIPMHPVAPAVTTAHLGAINTLLAAYSTSLGGSSRNRRHNIRVACQAIDGTVLMPGELFSYNETVGPRTERAGFRTAPVIIRGELVPGTGGGVCQVSSTLYNAALLGDLKIVRRTHHHFPVHYVPAGRDATVAYGSLDLRFANSLPQPVALDVKSVGSRVVVRLYGTADCKRDVQLVSRRLSAARRRAAAPGGAGKRVVVTRVVRLADGSVRREVISRDLYAPAPASSQTSSSRRPRRRRRTMGRERPPRQEAPAGAASPAAQVVPAADGR